MMDLKLFRDRTYSLAIIAIFAVCFTAYGMVLVITQYLQNVRGFSPTDAGLLLLSYSAGVMVVSLMAGKLVGVVGSRRLILLGLTSQIIGLAVLMVGMQASTIVVGAGLALLGTGTALCLTPITSLAMTAVPAERAGMASGIMSTQRALGSTVGFAVLGSILAATLTATLSDNLAGALPDPVEREEVAGGDHPERESPRLRCCDRARPTDPTSRRRHPGGNPGGRRQRLHRRHPLQPRNGHCVPRPRPRRRLCLVSPRQGPHRWRRACSNSARVGKQRTMSFWRS